MLGYTLCLTHIKKPTSSIHLYANEFVMLDCHKLFIPVNLQTDQQDHGQFMLLSFAKNALDAFINIYLQYPAQLIRFYRNVIVEVWVQPPNCNTFTIYFTVNVQS